MAFTLLSLLLSAGAALAPPRPAPAVVLVRAMDYSFTAPASIRAGVTTFRLTNAGKELHHLSIVRLPEGKSAADYLAAMKAEGHPPTWATDVGGPNAAIPGATIEATMSLDAGNYALVCFIPSPGKPVPHLMKGMVRPLTVRAPVRAGAMPAADVDIRLNDYNFALSKPLTAGRHVVRVTNDAEQPHEAIIIRLDPGKSITDASAWVEQGMQGPPPGMALAGVSPLSKGRSAIFPVLMTAGTYGLICFLPDAKDGKQHDKHGMVKQFEVAAR